MSDLVEAGCRSLVAGSLSRLDTGEDGLYVRFQPTDLIETQPGVHVIGPMPAGNVTGDRAVRQVEHCGRIGGFADELANVLHQALVPTESGSLRVSAPDS